MKSTSYPSQKKHAGVAALTVTVLITLIALVAAVYATKNSMLSQKNAANAAQSLMAQQAAEEGALAFEEQIRLDLASIAAGGSGGVILEKDTGSSSAGSGCLPGSGTLPYRFTSTYRKGTSGADALIFADAANFVRPAEVTAMVRDVANTDLGLSYQVKGKIVGRVINIYSVGNAAGGASAIVRRQINVSGGLSLGNSALTVGNYYDSTQANHITANAGDPLAQCAVLYGESYSSTGAADHKCYSEGNIFGADCTPTQSAGLQNNLFFNTFGKSKAELKASLLPSQIISSCNGTIAGIPDKYLWIEGDATNCKITGPNSVVIVNGNVRGGLEVNGFIYASNAYLDGATNINGSVTIENSVDVEPLGWPITHIGGALAGTTSANGKADSSDPNRKATHAAQVSFKITYKKYTGNPDGAASTNSSHGSWIDF
ncbi:pilus assembly PilX N-terminal domain-containing protein [Chitinilyticum piscinae]|uniref:Pilus assembly PilX N-terminal domain-containing protein n=1 Tax=Chitinilyticum piscinae TaxID=2866724 RepID=A0A8J7KBP6_9NEIS|nr:pilus assembly PilX N-terminal domain-containing protein [Chitinilyticum piscinae]MBE9610444.1 pilus assembly PilX N-terminal domain-containing protein [Chitinilyticum piscinae]